MKRLITATLLTAGLALISMPGFAQDANSELKVITDIQSLPTLSTDLSNPDLTQSDYLSVESVGAGETEIIIQGYELRVRGNDASNIPRGCADSPFLSTHPAQLNADGDCIGNLNPEVTSLTGSSRTHTTDGLIINRLGLVQVGEVTLGGFYGEFLAGDEADEFLNGTTGDDHRLGGVFGSVSF